MDNMINGLYGYFFGAAIDEENSAHGGTETADQENQDLRKKAPSQADEAEWILVDEGRSGRSSPVFVPDADLYELDSVISSASNISLAEKQKERELKKLEKEEKKKAARAALQQRQWMTMKMFEPTSATNNSSGLDSVGNTPPSPPAPVAKLTAAKLKRAGCAEIVKNEPKVKNRSKKNTAKVSAGRNNDRKCNNIN